MAIKSVSGIIRADLTIEAGSTLKLTGDTQVASGTTITIKAGASLDLGGYTVENFGTLRLSGGTQRFANLRNGTYIGKENSRFITTHGRLRGIEFSSRSDYDSILSINNSVIENSEVGPSPSSRVFSNSLFKDSTLDTSVYSITVSKSTFLNSPIRRLAWVDGYSGPRMATFSQVNFINDNTAIELDPFFSGGDMLHHISVSDSYIKTANGKTIDDYIYDADDDLNVAKDISPDSFTGRPYSNHEQGFAVGNVLVTWADLGLSGPPASDNLHLIGTPNNDILTGNTGQNTLEGRAGNDTLNGGAGADILRGGIGNDTYVVDNANDKVIELAGQGIDLVRSTISHTLASNVENLVLAGNRAINGNGSALANRLTGNGAANRLAGGTGNDTLIGNGGNDVLLGGTGNDTLLGGAGQDILNGGVGADILRGGVGNDVYLVDNANDRVVELAGQGIDLVRAAISHTLGNHVENLVLTGGSAINGNGNALANRLTGNGAANRLNGGTGNDTLIGNGGNDVLQGGAGNDVLLGAAGQDTLNGGAGSDTLIGGPGRDTLTGGLGTDRFRFSRPAEGGDTISDFTSGVDTIQVVSRNFAGLATGRLAPSRLIADGTTPASGNAVFLYNQDSGVLSFDSDGNSGAAAVHIATLTGRKQLQASDIQVISG